MWFNTHSMLLPAGVMKPRSPDPRQALRLVCANRLMRACALLSGQRTVSGALAGLGVRQRLMSAPLSQSVDILERNPSLTPAAPARAKALTLWKVLVIPRPMPSHLRHSTTDSPLL